MGHDHHHQHGSSKNLKVAFFLNLVFTIVEIIGGLWTNSVSILSDAIHDLGDSLSLGLSWYLERKALKKGDQNYSFGYQRFSLLGAVINGAVLLMGSVFILRETLPRLWNPEQPDAQGMMWIAILGVIFNGAAVLRLKKGTSLNEEMVSFHLLEDVLGWIAILIVSVILQFWDIPILDPLLSLLILVFVVYNVFKSLRKTSRVFLQGVPSEIDSLKLQEEIRSIPEVLSIHHAHVWSLDGQQHVLSIHLVVEKLESILELVTLKAKVRDLIREAGILHVTIELELQDEDCHMHEE